MLGLVMSQERDEAKMAATQNSPPLDLLGEIWGGGLALLEEGKEYDDEIKHKINCSVLSLTYVELNQSISDELVHAPQTN